VVHWLRRDLFEELNNANERLEA